MIKLYSATWCAPCKVTKAFIESNNLNDKVQICNVDETDDILMDAKSKGISSVPVLELEDGTLLRKDEIMAHLQTMVHAD